MLVDRQSRVRAAGKPASAARRFRACMEALEERRLLAHFAVIGDFSAGQPLADVATEIKSWSPDFIATVGDNYYDTDNSLDDTVGNYFHGYVSPYNGSHGSGSSSGNNFWPALGNHDYDNGLSNYTSFFTLPGNERYYTVTQGNVALFIVNSNTQEPDGTSSTSTQGTWLKNALAASSAQWKLVLFHHPAYSSGSMGSNSYMQWPFQQWGASAVIQGHDHDYERIIKNGFPYFVDGLGGASIVGWGSTVSGSQVRYNGDYGAMLIDTSSTSMNFQFINRSGQVIDTYSIGSSSQSAPSTPTGLSASAQSSTQAKLSWTDASPSLTTSFKIERSSDGGSSFTQVGTTLAGVTTFVDSGLSPGSSYVYRVRASNSAGDSSPSSNASVTLPTGSTTFISDMTWVSSSNGWGPVERDQSVGGSGSGDGHTITLNGVTYTKGLGAHASSSVVLNLNGQYSTFASDIGVDDETGPGTVDFQVFADGTKIYDSGTMTQAGATKSINLNVSNVTQLNLVVTDAGDGIDYDHADWANARLQASSGTSQAPAAPTGLIATAISPTQINVTWNNVANESSYTVQRSTDNANFTAIGKTAANVTSYSDMTVSGSTLYYYRVIASNASGDSPPSNVDSARPLQPPSAPSGLGASASGSQINLTWTINDTNTEESFLVERSANGSTGWTQIASVPDNNTYSDTGLTPATTYYYRVRASNTAGTSGYSNTASATTQSSSSLTFIPTGAIWKYLDNGSNQGTAWRATSFDDSTWKSGAAQLGYGDGDEATVVSYGSNANNKYITTYFRKSFSVADPSQISALNLRILRDDGAVVYLNGTEVYRNNMPTGAISYTTLASTAVEDPPNTYYSASISPSLLVAGTNVIAVEIHQADPTSSDISFDFELKATGTQTPTAPAAPTSLVATPASTSQVNLTWVDNSGNETNFILERSPDGSTGWAQIATPAANATSYSDTGLTQGTTYYYRIRATNSVGDSGNSNVSSATTLSPSAPAAPSNLVATAASSTQINLTWKDNASNETSFIVERSTDQNTWTQIATPAANAISYSDTGLTATTQYYYRVRAVNGVGPSANSNIANATTLGASSLPGSMVDGDVGTTGATGSATFSNGTYTVQGSGSDVWNGADSFNIAYQQMTGNCTIIARVASMQNTNGWAKAGIMIRNTLAANSVEASAFTTPSNGVAVIDRTKAGGGSSLTSSTGAAPYWLKLVRTSNTFTAYSSANGSTWTKVTSFTITMNSTVYVGLVVCAKSPGTLNTATFDNVSITSP